MKHCCIVLFFIAFSIAGVSFAHPGKTHTTSLLHEIAHKIYNLRKTLFADTVHKKNIETDLKKYEISIGHLAKNAAKTHDQLQQEIQKLNQLKIKQIKNNKKLIAEKTALKNQAVFSCP